MSERPAPSTTLLHEESGATAIEYGLIAALMTIALIAALGNMNQAMTGMYLIVQTITLYL
jgi:Flp pilus assembly pilin Flp